MRGVVPKNESTGAKVPSNRIKEKNPAPVSASTVGVMRAAVVQPNFWKINRPKIIMIRVMEPVAVLKLPCVRSREQTKGIHMQQGGRQGAMRKSHDERPRLLWIRACVRLCSSYPAYDQEKCVDRRRKTCRHRHQPTEGRYSAQRRIPTAVAKSRVRVSLELCTCCVA